jgi:hypothetical protein
MCSWRLAEYHESRKYATEIERYCHIWLAKLVRTCRTSMHPDCCLMFVTYTSKMLPSSLLQQPVIVDIVVWRCIMNPKEIVVLHSLGNTFRCYICVCFGAWCIDRRLVVCLLKPKSRPCSYLVNHGPKLNCPLSLYDQTHKNKCLDNFFVEHKMYPSLKQESRVCILGN